MDDARPVPAPEIPPDVAARRAALFRETPAERARRTILGVARGLKPAAWPNLPRLGRHWVADRMGLAPDFPDAAAAPTERDGFCGIARDLSPRRLMDGYRRGLHAAGVAGPAKWWSPPEHCVLVSFDDFHISRRLRARLRQDRHHVTFDRDFEGVIKGCAEPRAGRWPMTWITPEIMWSYAALYDAGHAHSFEVWNEHGELAGGGYGVALGGIFLIESQFSRETQSSKIGFCMLNWHLAKWGFALNSNKHPAQNVIDMGFRNIPRAEYLLRLAVAQSRPGRPGRWQVETDLATIAAWQPAVRPARAEAAA